MLGQLVLADRLVFVESPIAEVCSAGRLSCRAVPVIRAVSTFISVCSFFRIESHTYRNCLENSLGGETEGATSAVLAARMPPQSCSRERITGGGSASRSLRAARLSF